VRRRWISWVIALCLALSCALGPTPRSARAVGVASINSGGPAIGSFVADTGYSGGSAYSATNPVTTTGATNPAPTAVYQSERFGKTFSYTFVIGHVFFPGSWSSRLSTLDSTNAGRRRCIVKVTHAFLGCARRQISLESKRATWIGKMAKMAVCLENYYGQRQPSPASRSRRPTRCACTSPRSTGGPWAAPHLHQANPAKDGSRRS